MMNQETYVKLEDLRKQGWTIKEIAAETGYHPATISKWLREGPPTRRAAGSGKTTTALLRLREQIQVRLSRRERFGHDTPVRVLVLTFNRTLEGYICE